MSLDRSQKRFEGDQKLQDLDFNPSGGLWVTISNDILLHIYIFLVSFMQVGFVDADGVLSVLINGFKYSKIIFGIYI